MLRMFYEWTEYLLHFIKRYFEEEPLLSKVAVVESKRSL